MSKADAQRAMREARHAELRAAAADRARSRPPAVATGQPPGTTAQPPGTTAQPPGTTARQATKPDPRERSAPTGAAGQAEPGDAPQLVFEPSDGAGEAPEPALCGHRNIGNKSCRRPAGHPEKSHRYS